MGSEVACWWCEKCIYIYITSRSGVFWPETGGASVKVVFIDANHDVTNKRIKQQNRKLVPVREETQQKTINESL